MSDTLPCCVAAMTLHGPGLPVGGEVHCRCLRVWRLVGVEDRYYQWREVVAPLKVEPEDARSDEDHLG